MPKSLKTKIAELPADRRAKVEARAKTLTDVENDMRSAARLGALVGDIEAALAWPEGVAYCVSAQDMISALRQIRKAVEKAKAGKA